jgi:general secretion pathway protein A
MYKDHFKLREMPFSIAPDPRYFFVSTPHRDALMHLRQAAKGRNGAILLTGDVGAGKTLVCRRMVDELAPTCDVAMIYNPKLTAIEMLESICIELEVRPLAESETVASLETAINQHLTRSAARGRQTILAIDEAQNIDAAVIEQLRRLMEVKHRANPLLQIILIGQPELNHLLELPENRDFNKSIASRHHLGPLSTGEMAAYVQHRLHVGGTTKTIVPRRLMRKLHRLSQGVPRLINLICDRAMLGATVLGKRTVTSRILGAAGQEVLGGRSAWLVWKRWTLASIGALTLVAASASLAVALRQLPNEDVPKMSADVEDWSVSDLDPLDPSDWPDGMSGSRSRAFAFKAIFSDWNAPFKFDVLPCDQDGGKALRCVQGKGDLHELRRLNTPAVLQLADRNGRDSFVALVGLRGNRAMLQLGSKRREVSVPSLEARWSGRFTLVWRAPPSMATSKGVSTEKPTLNWVRERLSTLSGTKPALDGSIKNDLRAFQTSEGLVPDGEPNLRTLVRLSMRSEPGAPFLESTCGK